MHPKPFKLDHFRSYRAIAVVLRVSAMKEWV